MYLKNLKTLKDDMVKNKWTICSFLFEYKKIEYIVLIKRFVGTEKRIDEFALVKLHFMKTSDMNDSLEVEANSLKIIIEPQKLRNYFGIEWQENLGDIIMQFTKQLGNKIPKKIPNNISNVEKSAMLNSLSKSDAENPNKIYCGKVRRNPNKGKRSEYNSDKTKLLRASLFALFKNEPNVSFCYYEDINKENDDATILRNFSK